MAQGDEVVVKVSADVVSALQGLSGLGGAITSLTKEVTALQNTMKAGFGDMPKQMKASGTEATFFGLQLKEAYGQLVKMGTAAAKALPELVMHASEAGDQLLTLSQRTGVTVESLSKMRYITTQTDVSIDQMGRSVMDMGRMLQGESDKSVEAFEKLHLSVRELKAAKPEDAWLKVMEALGKVDDASERTALGTQVLGKSFRSMSQLAKEDLGTMMVEAKALGFEMGENTAKAADKFGDAMKLAGAMAQNTKNDIGNALIPALTQLVEMFPKAGGFAILMGQNLMTMAGGVGSLVTSLLPLRGDLGKLVKSAEGAVEAVTKLGKAAAAAAKGTDLLKFATAGFIGLGAAVVIMGIAAALENLDRQLKKVDEDYETLKKAKEASGMDLPVKLLQKTPNMLMALLGGGAEEHGAPYLDLALAKKVLAAQEAGAKGKGLGPGLWSKEELAAWSKAREEAFGAAEVSFKKLAVVVDKYAAELDVLKKDKPEDYLAITKAFTSANFKAGIDNIDKLHDKYDVSKDALKLLQYRIEEMTKAAEKLPFNKLKKEMEEFNTTLKNAEAAGLTAAQRLTMFGEAAQKLTEDASKLKGGLAALPAAIVQMTEAMDKAEISKFMREEVNKVNDAVSQLQIAQELEDQASEAQEAIASIGATDKLLANIDEAVKANEAAQEQITTFEKEQTTTRLEFQIWAIQQAAIKRKEAIDEQALQEKREGGEAALKAKALADQQAAVELYKLMTAQKEFNQALGTMAMMLPGILPMLGQWSEAMGRGTEKTKGAGGRLADDLKDMMVSIPGTLMNAFTGGGGKVGAFAAMGTQLGSIAGKSIGQAIGGIASMAGPMGAAIGALAGPMIEMFAKMFDHASKDIKRIAKGYGAEISDEVAKAIKESMKKLNLGEQAATLLNLDKLFPKIDASNFKGASTAVHDLFSMVETGQLTAAQGGATLDKVWQQLAATATSSTGVWSDGLKELIALNERLGTQSKEVAAMLQKNAEKAGAGFNDIVSGADEAFKRIDEATTKIKDTGKDIVSIQKDIDEAVAAKDSLIRIDELTTKLKGLKDVQAGAQRELATTAPRMKQELADMGMVAMAVYDNAIKAGKSHNEAIQMISGSLGKLHKAYEELGLNIESTGIKSLIAQGAMAEKFPQLIKGAEGLSGAMVALDNTGQMNQDTFEAMERLGVDMYTRLQSAAEQTGGTTRDALLPMQDYLHKAADKAKELNLPLDDNLQSMINQSQALGIWKDKAKTGTDLMIDQLKEVNKNLNDMTNKLGEFVDTFANMPTDKTMNIHWNVDEFPGMPPPHAAGGVFSSPHVGMIAEAGPEIIGDIPFMTRALTGALSRLSAIGSPMFSGGPPTNTITVGDIHIDARGQDLGGSSRQVAIELKRMLERELLFQVPVGVRS